MFVVKWMKIKKIVLAKVSANLFSNTLTATAVHRSYHLISWTERSSDVYNKQTKVAAFIQIGLNQFSTLGTQVALMHVITALKNR